MFKVPGVAWITLLAFLSGWLGEYFGDYLWTATAVAVIGGVIKFLEVFLADNRPSVETSEPSGEANTVRSASPVMESEGRVRWSKTTDFFFG